MRAILGQKVGMTRIYDQDGIAVSVTVISATPNQVTQVKTVPIDGYSAIQLGAGIAKRLSKAVAGHLQKSGSNARFLKEVRIGHDPIPVDSENTPAPSVPKLGDQISLDAFSVGDKVSVTAVSKGKGFAGTVKRHNFNTGPKTHGSHNYRAPGSIGAGYPQHVFRGQKMAGRMGHDQVTTRGLKIMAIDQENHLVALKGAVPGPRRGQVLIKAQA